MSLSELDGFRMEMSTALLLVMYIYIIYIQLDPNETSG